MVLCSQLIPCKSCQCCAAPAAARTVTTSPPRDHVQWFRREWTSGYHTESRLNVRSKTVMNDETALATFNELRRLDRRFKAEAQLPRTRCEELRTLETITPFRFLDLPAEVRVCIYEYAVRDTFVHRIRNFATPALARTSQQLRAESLPVWFAINTFVAEVKSNFLGISACATHGNKAEYIAEQDTRYRRLGKLDLSAVVAGLLATCPPSTIKLKNIDFCCLSAGSRRDRLRSDRFAMLSVRDGRPVRITTHVGGGTSDEYTKHVLRMFDHGQKYLQQLVAKPEYQGLYMLQVKDIAAAFRAEAPPSAVPEPPPHTTVASAFPVRQNLKLEKQDSAGSHSDSWMFEQPPVHEVMRLPSADDASDEFDLPQAEVYFSLC
ncbi:hypothetical protein Slin14017_G062020 [Septoria linicola]|nr:hypothetical protein Slin14017_G062020 [Septoria linicola]